ncbi:GTPase activating protein (SH3 domain) binding protein 1 L homeolog isoform X1 [Xenopus laevis]|uniref:GTPase activating protein (SH3 domain) binding protein 1 L homeolog isoform X1 n=3 Tax=Xenopus laevis TaxID=8355 RepID=A0A8J0UF42_XENLA|nr:GTPase activating protein (SH3 domain) binding protein 1 L homeolog isoform X1 [Xenopus laevis]
MMLLPSSGPHGPSEEETVLSMAETGRKFQLTKEMVMEKPSPLLVGREFVRQYYTLLNQAPDFLHRFYGKSSSYVHGGLDSNGKPADAVYGQTDIHKKVMSLNFKDCRTKIRHVDAHATLNDGVVVQVMGELSNNRQPMRRFMQTFLLAPEGSVANKFYVHNDIFRYQDEVFGDSDTEPPEESDEEAEEPEERQQSPELVATDEATYYEQPGSNDLDEPLEDQIVEAEPEQEPELEQEPEMVEEKCEPTSEEPAPEEEEEETVNIEKSPSPPPADPAPAVQEDPRTFSWASVTSKNLPPSGAVPVSGIPPHVVKVQTSQPRPDTKSEAQTTTQRPPQRDQRVREQRTTVPPPRGPRPLREGEPESETRRINRYPDSHQLFVGNLPHDVDKTELKEFFQTYGNVVELRINSGGKLPNFGFVVFDDAEPVQKILGNRPIMFRADVRLNVEEKKTRAAREGDRRVDRPRGPGGPRGGLGGGLRGPPRGAMSQKPGFGAGRGNQGPRQ